jgi:hypothetical protein
MKLTIGLPKQGKPYSGKKKITQTGIQTIELMNGLPESGKPFSDLKKHSLICTIANKN